MGPQGGVTLLSYDEKLGQLEEIVKRVHVHALRKHFEQVDTKWITDGADVQYRKLPQHDRDSDGMKELRDLFSDTDLREAELNYELSSLSVEDDGNQVVATSGKVAEPEDDTDLQEAETKSGENAETKSGENAETKSGEKAKPPLHDSGDFLYDRLVAISGRTGAMVDAVSFHFESGSTTPYGGTGGDDRGKFEFEEDEVLIKVVQKRPQSSEYLGHAFVFTTNKGRVHELAGGNKGDDDSYSVSSGTLTEFSTDATEEAITGLVFSGSALDNVIKAKLSRTFAGNIRFGTVSDPVQPHPGTVKVRWDTLPRPPPGPGGGGPSEGVPSAGDVTPEAIPPYVIMNIAAVMPAKRRKTRLLEAVPVVDKV